MTPIDPNRPLIPSPHGAFHKPSTEELKLMRLAAAMLLSCAKKAPSANPPWKTRIIIYWVYPTDLVPDHENFQKNLRPDFSAQKSAEGAGNLNQVVEPERKAGLEKMGQIPENFRGKVLEPKSDNFKITPEDLYRKAIALEEKDSLDRCILFYKQALGLEPEDQSLKTNIQYRLAAALNKADYKKKREIIKLLEEAETHSFKHQELGLERQILLLLSEVSSKTTIGRKRRRL